MIQTLPLALRDRLADVIVAAPHDRAARAEVRHLALAGPASLTGWLAPGEERHATLLGERARSAARALEPWPLGSPARSLVEALAAAGLLWKAGLFFEVHELLEPWWLGASGDARQALQGLVQAAVGYQHLANGNLRGARALLDEGARRLAGRWLGGCELDGFARALGASAQRVEAFDWSLVPPFPSVNDGA